MTTIEKITVLDYLKEILRKIEPSNTNGITISRPVFVFEKKENEDSLLNLISKLQTEVYFDEHGK
jgi:hypothetical protein